MCIPYIFPMIMGARMGYIDCNRPPDKDPSPSPLDKFPHFPPDKGGKGGLK